MRSWSGPVATLCLVLTGCGDGGEGGAPGADAGAGAAGEVVLLPPAERLVRASVALRGVRPPLDELERVRDDPGQLEELVDSYLASDGFGETVRDMHDETLLTRFATLPPLGELADTPTGRLQSSIGEEPLRLVEHVVMGDRPYTEIVTADYTMANPVVAAAYGLEHVADGPEWQVAHYTDGRPAAGVLSTNAFYLRHRSAGANWHRGRANAVSKALLCSDFLSRDVVVDGAIDLSDPDAVASAVVENPACASCHQTLDPLASFFWGFEPNLLNMEVEQAGYPLPGLFRADQTGRWRRTSRRPPAFFGLTGDGLGDLGQLIAHDPRFSQCAAKRFYAYLAQVDLDAVPLELAARLQQTFVASGYSARALARAVVLSDEFAASHATGEGAAEGLVGMKKARPSELARLIEDLTGFAWRTDSDLRLRGGRVGPVDLLRDDAVGFRVLAGGIDSYFVVEPSHTFNATSVLVLRALAAAAAGYAVDADFDRAAADRALLTRVEPDTRDEAAVRAQLAELYARFYTDFAPPESEGVGEAYALFKGTLDRTGDVAHAWKTTLTAMLQDLRIATY
jgi:hypothetical protein